MDLEIPRKLALFGGLIPISGLVNTALGLEINALVYDLYPGGSLGHVGILTGIGALLLGLVIIFAVLRLYKREKSHLVALAGV